MMMANNNFFQSSISQNNANNMNQMMPGFAVMAPMMDPNDTIVMERDSI
jgi:hypothetical protein